MAKRRESRIPGTSSTAHLGHHQSRTAKRDRQRMVSLGMLTGPNTRKELFNQAIKHTAAIKPRAG